MNFKEAIKGFTLFIVFVFIFGLIIYSSKWLLDRSKNYALSSVLEAGSSQIKKNVTAKRDWSIPTLDIGAKSAIAVETDLSSGRKMLFSKNVDDRLPIASLTKLMTAMVVLDNYGLSDSVYVSKDADKQSPMVHDLKSGDVFPVESLLKIMLIESSNKAAFALAEKTGVSKFIFLMNQKAQQIGLLNTTFTDPTGFSNKNFSTSSDLAKLVEYVLRNYPKIVDISRTKEIDIEGFGKIVSTNELLGEIPEIIGGKTGFTTDAKGCLILVINNERAGDYLVYVVLGSEDRFLEMKNIINWLNIAYQWQ